MKTLYLLIHLITVTFPLIRSFEPKIQYAKKWKALLPGLFITAILFLVWDIIFTKEGVWGFNEKYYLGIHLFGLPVEEWLFFITVPFASVFIYECVVYFFSEVKTSGSLQLFSLLLAFFLIFIGVLNRDKAYTFWNFLFSGSFLLYTGYKNPSWLGKFWLAYVFHLIPFILINGILTGSFIEGQVVWYNNEENLGIRIGTIPLEDTIYSLLLLLMNVSFFEWFKKLLGAKNIKVYH